MPPPERTNALLVRLTGRQLTRPPSARVSHIPPPRGGRLLTGPVFIFSAARAGSTLLRAIMGSHPGLYAPPELPLKQLRVRAETKWIKASLDNLRLTVDELDYLLWDRVLADALERSGKPTIVVKTPSNVLVWKQIATCWPDARFIFLLRHPAASVASLHSQWNGNWHPDEDGSFGEALAKGLRYMSTLEEARSALDGLTVRYEELTADPEATVREICAFLGVPFEPRMLDYGRFEHEGFAVGLGDSSEKIRSGRIQEAAPPPEQVPAELAGICASWGYLEAGAGPARPGRPGSGS
jgi:hypothetical protein